MQLKSTIYKKISFKFFMLIGIVYDYLYTKYELKLSTVSKDTEDLKFDKIKMYFLKILKILNFQNNHNF